MWNNILSASRSKNHFHYKKPSIILDFPLAVWSVLFNPVGVMQRYLPLILVVGLLIVFRLLGTVFSETLPNFQPLVAVFFCGALLASGWRGFAIPFAAWAITYPLGIGPIYNPFIFATTLLALSSFFLIGKFFVGKKVPVLLLGSAIAAVVFHLITNTAAWIGDPMYAKTLTGFWQSIWTGPIGTATPSWVFLRNLTAANVLFTGMIVLAQVRLPKARVSATSALAKSH